jgi:ABC-type multidrug transport system fused ATPase/permease subunit
MLPAAIVAGCPVLAWFVLDYGTQATYVLVGAVALAVAVYVGVCHPLWMYWALAFLLAGIPFGYVPGVHLPMYLPFAAGTILAAIIYPRTETPYLRLEKAILILVVVSGVSVVVTSLTLLGLVQYARWSIVTLVAVALLRLSKEDLERFGRIFVWVTVANAIWGMLLVTVDKYQKSFAILKPFGYDIARVEVGVRNGQEQLIAWAYNQDGSQAIRLAGTWVGPNGASLAFVIAIPLCLMLFRGWLRNSMVIILSVALLLTLSRQAIFTLLVGLILVLIFHPMQARSRWQALTSLALMAVTALSVPYVRARLISSFLSSDYGGSARRASLLDFPSQLSGHWLFGLGWARPEFKSGEASYALNLISNAPLLQIYRGGILTGLAFLVVCVIGCVIGYRALRSDSLPFAVFGGVFIAFCLVALQLDHGVTDIPQTTLCFSILLAFLGYIDRSLHDRPQQSAPTNEAINGAPHGTLANERDYDATRALRDQSRRTVEI